MTAWSRCSLTRPGSVGHACGLRGNGVASLPRSWRGQPDGPKLRQQTCETEIIECYRRRESSVEEVSGVGISAAAGGDHGSLGTNVGFRTGCARPRIAPDRAGAAKFNHAVVWAIPLKRPPASCESWASPARAAGDGRGNRVASHSRGNLRNRHTTVSEHMPSSHRRYAGADDARGQEDRSRRPSPWCKSSLKASRISSKASAPARHPTASLYVTLLENRQAPGPNDTLIYPAIVADLSGLAK